MWVRLMLVGMCLGRTRRFSGEGHFMQKRFGSHLLKALLGV